MKYEAATGSLFVIHISIYLYRISVTRIAVPVRKGSSDAKIEEEGGKSARFTVDAARHVKLPLNMDMD